MKTSDGRVKLAGRLRRRKDGALCNQEGDLLIEPTAEMHPEGHPGERPPDSFSKEYQAWWPRLNAWRKQAILGDAYSRLMTEIIEQQKTEPWWLRYDVCIYQDKIYEVDSRFDPTERVLLVKHFVLRQQQDFKRISREIEAFENLERLTHREVIPESVRIFVWQRDKGRCVDCGRRDSLEFDHIIPLAEGGASTERNIQLRCTPL